MVRWAWLSPWLCTDNLSSRALSCNFNLLCRFFILSEKSFNLLASHKILVALNLVLLQVYLCLSS